jgi:hypothetical protein
MRRTQKPASPEQLAANRANAAQSSGPETPGAAKHGVTDSTFAIARLDFYLVSVYQPVNSQELFALKRMALRQRALLRAARLESGFFTTSLNETLDANDRPCTPMSKEFAGDGAIDDFNRHDLPNEDLLNEPISGPKPNTNQLLTTVRDEPTFLGEAAPCAGLIWGGYFLTGAERGGTVTVKYGIRIGHEHGRQW